MAHSNSDLLTPPLALWTPVTIPNPIYLTSMNPTNHGLKLKGLYCTHEIISCFVRKLVSCKPTR